MIASVLLLSAAVVSLVGTGLDLVKASQAQSAGRVALTVVGVVTVGLSWAVVQTVFALCGTRTSTTRRRSAGSISSRTRRPDYLDFAYIAFTIGMTFQVSDTDIQRKQTPPHRAPSRVPRVSVRRRHPRRRRERHREHC